jgi:vacuolar protein sorting-associated protein 35
MVFVHIKNASPDLYVPHTTQNLLNLLIAPVNSYQSVLTLLALPCYLKLFAKQPLTTRRSIAHSIISSVLKNETIIETPEDVDGVLELCQVLISDPIPEDDEKKEQPPPHPAPSQSQSELPTSLPPLPPPPNLKQIRRAGPLHLPQSPDEMAEEQGWVARMVHLFRSESLGVQFEVDYIWLGVPTSYR